MDNIFVTYTFVIQTAIHNPDGTVARSYDGFHTRSEMHSALDMYRENLEKSGMKEGRDFVLNVYERDVGYGMIDITHTNITLCA